MTDRGIGDYFISDIDETPEDDDELLVPPVILPSPPAAPTAAQTPGAAPATSQPASPGIAVPPPGYGVPAAAPAQQAAAPAPVQPAAAPVYAAQPPTAAARPQAGVAPRSREDRIVAALDELMDHSPDVQAAALVSLDGFTMASALPAGMQEDRVGAMSAAILGLGERAAAELGRGRLSQVFIEGADGYVLLMAAGERAVLTVLADREAKLGLTLYDMRATAETIGDVLR